MAKQKNTQMGQSGPSLCLALSELHRSAAELATVPVAWPWMRKVPKGQGEPILLLPPFTTADWSTSLLRKYLASIGYTPYKWRQGTNVNALHLRDYSGAMNSMETALAGLNTRLPKISERHQGKPVTLIGWSLGGVLARKLASQRPDLVKRVITLGSPMGDVRDIPLVQSLMWYRKADVTAEQAAAWMDFIDVDHQDVPVDVLYSNGDGIVTPEMATSHNQGQVTNIKVAASHIGFGANPLVFRLLAQRLALA